MSLSTLWVQKFLFALFLTDYNFGGLQIRSVLIVSISHFYVAYSPALVISVVDQGFGLSISRVLLSALSCQSFFQTDF